MIDYYVHFIHFITYTNYRNKSHTVSTSKLLLHITQEWINYYIQPTRNITQTAYNLKTIPSMAGLRGYNLPQAQKALGSNPSMRLGIFIRTIDV